MPDQIPWKNRLNVKLGALTLALLIVSSGLVAGNLYMLSTIEGDSAAMNHTSRGRMRAYQMLFLSRRLMDETAEAQAFTRHELATVIDLTEERFVVLRDGDPALDIPPADDERILAEIEDRQALWRTRVRPALEAVSSTPNLTADSAEVVRFEQEMLGFLAEIDEGIDLYQDVADEKVRDFELIQYLFIAVVLVIFAGVFWFSRGITGRVRTLAATARRIAGGELSVQAPIAGNDELTMLGDSFNAMTSDLLKKIETERLARDELEALLIAVAATAESLASGTAEILAGTSQQASGAQEQVAAVSETVITVDEVTQTADQAAQRARTVAGLSQRSVEVGNAGRKAVEDSIVAMRTVQHKVESIAESIVELSEQAQAIGEIIGAVKDIAEQTNLLAINASIEASRAGEHGRSFQVVAVEIKALANQAKKATGQVRQLLGEIEKATHSAVMATEDGQKRVNATVQLVNAAGETINSMTETIAEAAIAAAQISASAGQQAAGVAQIHQAMKSISEATKQNLASTRQQERAARDLNGLGTSLTKLLTAKGR